MKSFFKTPVNRSSDYLNWIRAQPSVESGQLGCVAHHIVGHGRLSTSRSDDFLAIPLTDAEHKDLHQHGWVEWERKHGSQKEHAADLLVRAVTEGVLRIHERAVKEAL